MESTVVTAEPSDPLGPPSTAPAQPTTAIQPLSTILPQPVTGPRSTPLPAKLQGIGTLDLRTPDEDIQFRQCETVIGEGTANCARIGVALITIRENRLYKNEYPSFEVYCRERWGFKHSMIWRYIAAAEVYKKLAGVPGMPLPDSEAQIRPLVGLSSDQALQVWTQALGWSREGYVPAQLVKRSVKQLLKTERPAVAAQENANKQQRMRLRQSVRTGFQELLTLLLKNPDRDVLIPKVQEIERLLEPILRPKKKGR